MTEVREATGPDSDRWQEDWRGRLEAGFGRHDVPPDWTSRQVQRRVAEYRDAVQRSALAVTAARQTVGILALVLAPEGGPPRAAIADLWIAPAHRRRGYGSAALRWAESQARCQVRSEAGSQVTLAAGDTHLSLNVFGSNAVATRLYERMGYQTVDQSRSIDL